MKRLLLFAVIAMIGLSSCGTSDQEQVQNVSEKQEKVNVHPTYIGGRWYYIIY